MKLNSLIAALLLPLAATTFAAPAQYVIVDHSTANLVTPAEAEAAWLKHQSPKVVKLFPAKKWGFLSQVEGGIDNNKTCVITARALMLPRAGKNLVFKPEKSATTFGSVAAASPEQCKALAKAKLDEAIVAIGSALVPN